MNAAIRHATRIPCSLAIIKKFAKHGMNSVMVTIATRICREPNTAAGPVAASRM